MDVLTQIAAFEGRRSQAYPDPLTGGAPWTIGCGHTGPDVHEGACWSDDQIDAALRSDVDKADFACQVAFDWYFGLNEPRRAVLVNMAFQMGINGLLAFKNTLAVVRDERFEDAAESMRQSEWAKQTPTRARALAAQMATGEWQT